MSNQDNNVYLISLSILNTCLRDNVWLLSGKANLDQGRTALALKLSSTVLKLYDADAFSLCARNKSLFASLKISWKKDKQALSNLFSQHALSNKFSSSGPTQVTHWLDNANDEYEVNHICLLFLFYDSIYFFYSCPFAAFRLTDLNSFLAFWKLRDLLYFPSHPPCRFYLRSTSP